MIVNQWLPTAHQGDAMGDGARHVRNLLRHLGHTSDVYAIEIESALEDDVLPYDAAGARRGDVTIFHYGIDSPMTAAFAGLPGRRVLQYHNVTPAEFFAPWDERLFLLATRGREGLASLAGHVDIALGDSDYNRRELAEAGFERTGIFPVPVDTGRVLSQASRPALEAVLDDGFMNFLFVGRIAPNKKIEDHLRLAALYLKHVDAACRFIFVGRCDVVPQYYSALWAMASRFRLPGDRVVFTGAVSGEELAIYYQFADVYISLSEHEGFCAPLVEAMAADVPVLAYAAAAVPETLGGAGVQFAPKDLPLATELLAELAFNSSLRTDVLAGQQRRLTDFSDARIERDLTALLGSLS